MEQGLEIKAVVLGYDRELYQKCQLGEFSKVTAAADKICIFYEDNTSVIYDFQKLYPNPEDRIEKMQQLNANFKSQGLKQSDYKSYFTDNKQFQKYYNQAKSKKENSKAKTVLGLALAGAAIGAAAVAAAKGLDAGIIDLLNKNTTTIDEDNLSEEQGYGFYKYDLSNMEGIEEYINEIPDSPQKEGALLRLAILQNFNKEIKLVDGETDQLGGLTIEQLVALDAYANSNIYSKEDYIKNFGLYDFSNVSSDFQQAVMQTGAFLAIPEVDGTALADIFKDETVKTLYLKSLEYRDSILNAENDKDQKKAVEAYEGFLASQSDVTSENYVDYSEHPGMAFVTPAIVLSLDYHNIGLSSGIVSQDLIIGTDEHRSLVDTVCASAEVKMDSVVVFVGEMEQALIDNQTSIIYNNKEIEVAEKENRTPVLLQLKNGELDELVRTTLCDQNQINELINKELTKTNQLVTAEDQQVILVNAANMKNQFSPQRYADAATAEIAQQLNETGTATVTQHNVQITTPSAVQDLMSSNPELAQKAKDELNQSQGLIPNETPEEQQAFQEKEAQDIEDTKNEGESYYNQVLAYYEANGRVEGIPASLQTAYNNLGDYLYNLAKQTGIARWEAKNQPTIGGEETRNPGFEDVDINAKPQSSQQQSTTDQNTQQEEQQTPSVDNNVNNEPTVDNNTATSDSNNNEFGGEETINPEFGDVDMGDVSTNPYSVTEATSDISSYIANMTEEEWNALITPSAVDSNGSELSGPTR